jgi:hypothetical protein
MNASSSTSGSFDDSIITHLTRYVAKLHHHHVTIHISDLGDRKRKIRQLELAQQQRARRKEAKETRPDVLPQSSLKRLT